MAQGCNMKYRILVVDDEKNIREGIRLFLEDEGYEVIVAENGRDAINLLKEIEIDLVLSDLRMSPISGEQLLQHIVTRSPAIPVVMLSGHGSVELAVQAIHKGAYDFLTKPVDLDRMLILFKRALQARELFLQNRKIREELNQQKNGKLLNVQSRSMQKVMERIELVAPATSSILITGESGVGKEVLCNYIHQLSGRRDKPFVSVHCAALSESLLESELFGHEKGAFTGAIAQKKGRFELANGGTIFLDEIGEIDANLQVKLLRVLQEQAFERVGGESTIKVDVRVIAATNRNLKKEVQEGRFREDLYYRLSVVNIEVPPLRERKEDILPLTLDFLEKSKQENSRETIEGFSKEAMKLITDYNWPGNIRELRNCVESSVVLCTGKNIEVEDLPDTLRNFLSDNKITLPINISLKEYEKCIIKHLLSYYKWNKSKVADILEIGRKTLHNKIDDYNISEEML